MAPATPDVGCPNTDGSTSSEHAIVNTKALDFNSVPDAPTQSTPRHDGLPWAWCDGLMWPANGDQPRLFDHGGYAWNQG